MSPHSPQKKSTPRPGLQTAKPFLLGPLVRAVLFDVDGTLYHQKPLQSLMAMELAGLPLASRSLQKARRTWKAIGAFRKVREKLRERGASEDPLEDLQFHVSQERTGEEKSELEAIVSEWIYQRPLKYLKLCRRAGLEGLLSFLKERAVLAGALSDYPVAEKLQALGVSSSFSIRLCTTDPDINAFKPHPRGFLRACELWGIPPEEVLYVGDRADVDAKGAAASGMRCAILTGLGLAGMGSRRFHRQSSVDYLSVSSLSQLRHRLTEVVGPLPRR